MRHTMILSAAALFTTAIASAQTGSIPDPSSPTSSEDRATPAEMRDTMPDKSSAKSGRSSGFNAMESAGGTLTDKDVNFVKKAASIGAEEVEAGKLAADQADSSEVKTFADQMVTDHGQNNDELKGVVEKKGITLPGAPQGAQKTELASLKAKKGAAFDKAYAAAMVKGHQSAIQLFTTASKSAKDPEVKSYAEKTLPALKHHLEMAQSLQKSVGASAMTGKTSKSKKSEVKPTDTSGG